MKKIFLDLQDAYGTVEVIVGDQLDADRLAKFTTDGLIAINAMQAQQEVCEQQKAEMQPDSRDPRMKVKSNLQATIDFIKPLHDAPIEYRLRLKLMSVSKILQEVLGEI